MARTDELLSFFAESEKMKLVYRKIWLSDASRHESDAEHSWHLALFLLLFEKELGSRVDIGRALRMALVHDLVEVRTGDVSTFDEQGRQGKAERELAGAKALFGTLPADIGDEFLALFVEFEACETPEAKAVKAFDKLHPMFMNLLSDGRSWKLEHITYERLDAHKRPLMAHDPVILALYERFLREAKERKLLE